MGNSSYPAFINQIVPNINPPIDFISYSNWEIEEAQQRSADEIGTVLGDALDFINCHLPPKPCVPEPRVFVGEFGYFLRNNNCTAADAPPVKAGQGPHMDTTSEIIKQRTLWHAASAIAWGSPMNLYWELYSNEKGIDAKGQRCDKGYWLVNDQGQDEPVFAALKAYYSAADAFVRRHARAHGGAAPDINAFRRWAVAKLADLTGYVGVAPPKVRELDPAAALIAGGH